VIKVRAKDYTIPIKRQPALPMQAAASYNEVAEAAGQGVCTLGKLSHVDESGRASMVDVGGKPDSERSAVARGHVSMKAETLALIEQGMMKKGDVLVIAQIAGMMAAKRTSDLIPLCHPLPVTHIDVTVSLNKPDSRVDIEARVRTSGKTGVEMEALTAVSVAGLTIYDMAKAVDREMRIEAIRLAEKHGGQSGDIVLE
jgi:cyclic pyranopterin monophosphate synthase